MGNAGGFGIGTYQPVTGGTTVGAGFPTTPFQLQSPYDGSYGGTYGFVLDTTIRAPNSVVYTPVLEIGLDGVGTSVVRGFPALEWDYPLVRPDVWYKFKFLWNQSARTSPGFQTLVLIQYPDVTGSGTLIRQLARMEPPAFAGRTVSTFQSVVLKFTYIGQAVLDPGTPVTVLS